MSETSDTSNEIETSALSLDDIFGVLVSPRRRIVLYVLSERSGAVDVDELVTAVAAVESADCDAVAVDQHTQIAIALDHTHLPKLERAGLVTHDREAGTVEMAGIPRQFERYLRFAAEDERRVVTEDAEA